MVYISDKERDRSGISERKRPGYLSTKDVANIYVDTIKDTAQLVGHFAKGFWNACVGKKEETASTENDPNEEISDESPVFKHRRTNNLLQSHAKRDVHHSTFVDRANTSYGNIPKEVADKASSAYSYPVKGTEESPQQGLREHFDALTPTSYRPSSDFPFSPAPIPPQAPQSVVYNFYYQTPYQTPIAPAPTLVTNAYNERVKLISASGLPLPAPGTNSTLWFTSDSTKPRRSASSWVPSRKRDTETHQHSETLQKRKREVSTGIQTDLETKQSLRSSETSKGINVSASFESNSIEEPSRKFVRLPEERTHVGMPLNPIDFSFETTREVKKVNQERDALAETWTIKSNTDVTSVVKSAVSDGGQPTNPFAAPGVVQSGASFMPSGFVRPTPKDSGFTSSTELPSYMKSLEDKPSANVEITANIDPTINPKNNKPSPLSSAMTFRRDSLSEMGTKKSETSSLTALFKEQSNENGFIRSGPLAVTFEDDGFASNAESSDDNQDNSGEVNNAALPIVPSKKASGSTGSFEKPSNISTNPFEPSQFSDSSSNPFTAITNKAASQPSHDNAPRFAFSDPLSSSNLLTSSANPFTAFASGKAQVLPESLKNEFAENIEGGRPTKKLTPLFDTAERIHVEKEAPHSDDQIKNTDVLPSSHTLKIQEDNALSSGIDSNPFSFHHRDAWRASSGVVADKSTIEAEASKSSVHDKPPSVQMLVGTLPHSSGSSSFITSSSTGSRGDFSRSQSSFGAIGNKMGGLESFEKKAPASLSTAVNSVSPFATFGSDGKKPEQDNEFPGANHAIIPNPFSLGGSSIESKSNAIEKGPKPLLGEVSSEHSSNSGQSLNPFAMGSSVTTRTQSLDQKNLLEINPPSFGANKGLSAWSANLPTNLSNMGATSESDTTANPFSVNAFGVNPSETDGSSNAFSFGASQSDSAARKKWKRKLL